MKLRPAVPPGWAHPYFGWHRAWHARRVWQARARMAVGILLVTVLAVLFGAPKWLMAASVIGLVLPVPLRRERSLREIEDRYGAAYTTALTAPDDQHGFARRLRGYAENIVRNGELPSWPTLETVVAVALVALPFVVSFAPASPGADAQTVAAARPNPPGSSTTPELEAPPVVLEGAEAPAANSRGGTSAPGKAARSGSVPEGQVGQVRPGGGLSNEAPDEVSRDFMDALERGAIRSADGTGTNRNGQIEDRDRTGKGSNASGNGTQQGGNGQDGQSSDPSNGQNGQRNPNQRGQPNQQNGNQQGQQNGQNASGKNQPGQQGQNGQNNPSQGNSQGQEDPSRRFERGQSPDENGQQGSGDSFDPGQQNQNGNNQLGSNQGGRGSSDPNKPGTVDPGQGKLQYLPGMPRGEDRRSGALQLPGDPRRPLTATPGSPQYRRAAESAILDPRLPPEYQEMLKNYYR